MNTDRSTYRRRVASLPARPLVCGVMLLCSTLASGDDGPRVALDTTELVADIRATREVASGVEDGLQVALDRLAEHTVRLEAAGCEIGGEEPECRDMKSDMRADYLMLLDGVEGRLPALRSSVDQVVRNLERRMAEETGANLGQIQEEITSGNGASARRRPSLQGVSGSRLSESLGALQQLVSSADSGQVSLRAIQSDLYLDMRESLAVIDNLEADIDRTRILAELQLGEMQVSRADQETAERVRGYLFGEPEKIVPGRVVPATPDDGDYRSPLEY